MVCVLDSNVGISIAGNNQTSLAGCPDSWLKL